MSKLVLVCLLFLPVFCKAQTICPWLNEATAAGLLNGPVSPDVQKRGDRAGTCDFHLKDAPSGYGLKIDVHEIGGKEKGIVAYESHCASSPVPLQAIGNEAVVCTVLIGRSRGEEVVGRVRDRVFIVRMDAAMSDNRSDNSKLLREKVTGVAEQVAGSLF